LNLAAEENSVLLFLLFPVPGEIKRALSTPSLFSKQEIKQARPSSAAATPLLFLPAKVESCGLSVFPQDRSGSAPFLAVEEVGLSLPLRPWMVNRSVCAP